MEGEREPAGLAADLDPTAREGVLDRGVQRGGGADFANRLECGGTIRAVWSSTGVRVPT